MTAKRPIVTGAISQMKSLTTKNEDVNYKPTNAFNAVKDEFEAIAGIVENTGTWVEVE